MRALVHKSTVAVLHQPSCRTIPPIQRSRFPSRSEGDEQAEQLALQRRAAVCEIGCRHAPASHLGHSFASIPVHRSGSGTILKKLAVTQPGDIYEQEADRVSEKVVNARVAPSPHLPASDPNSTDCQNGAEQLVRSQVSRLGGGEPGQAAPEIVDQVLASPGQPLDRATRAFMERHFSYDFGEVRVHTDARAAESARSVKSLAYAVGHDVVFDTGRFSPETSAGIRLLAHELTHVVQQSLPLVAPLRPLTPSFTEQSTFVLQQPSRPSLPPSVVQRDGMVGLVIGKDARNRENAKEFYANFVDGIRNQGLPVKFLTDVGRVVALLTDDTNAYAPGNDEMHLKEETIKGALSPSPDSSAVQSIYHESTHAYLAQHRHKDPVRKFYDEGTKYYEGAPTSRNGVTSDPEEVFQEAAATYVGSRAGAWVRAYLSVLSWVQHGDRPFTLEDIAGVYDKTMAERVLGYSMEGGMFSKEQVSTKRPIAEEARAFLDHELLEGKIPDHFDEVASFKRLIANAPQIRANIRSWPTRDEPGAAMGRGS